MKILKSLLRRQRHLALAAHAVRQTLPAQRHKMSRTPQGFLIAGNPLMQAGTFEPTETALISELLARHDRFVDCGANIGFFSCLARSLGKGALVVEPLAGNLKLLLANLAENGWSDTEVVAAGLAAHPGIATLFGSDTGASLVSGWSRLPQNTLLRERIALTTLDAVLGDRFAGERLLIKVDVEGAELGLLKGAAKTLPRRPAPVWLVEICLTENFPGGHNPAYEETFAMFFDSGYRAFAATPARTEVRRDDVAAWARAGQAGSGTHNYLFTRES